MALPSIQRSIAAILIGLGCVFLQLSPAAAVATNDDPLLRRVMATQIGGGYDRLVVAIEALRYIKLNDGKGSSAGADNVYYAERFLERLWLGDQLGMARPKAQSVADAIALEKQLAASAPLSLFELREKVYTAALLLGRPQPGDPLPEIIRQAPGRYLAVGEHRWQYAKSSPSVDSLVEIMLTNEFDQAILLPSRIELLFSTPAHDLLVGFRCIERRYDFANDAAQTGLELPGWHVLASGRRVAVLCSSSLYVFPNDMQSVVNDALNTLGQRTRWTVNPETQPGETKATALLWLSRALRTAETPQQALRLLGKSDRFAVGPRIRQAGAVEVVRWAASVLAVCALVYTLYFMIRERRWREWDADDLSLALTVGVSGILLMSYFAFVYTLDPKSGWVGEVMIEWFGRAVVVALGIIWVAFAAYRNHRQRRREKEASRHDPQ